MESLGVLEAKNSLSALLAKIENGEQDCIVIRRHKKPIAKIVPFDSVDSKRNLGILSGKYILDDSWDSDELNAEIAKDFSL